MKITRRWAMPSKNTFSIPPVRKLIEETMLFVNEGGICIDPFANNSDFNQRLDFTNDIDPDVDTTHHLDALEFLQLFDTGSVDLVLFDPPYSPRQVSECYKSLGRSVNMQTTQSSFWGNIKKEISRVVRTGGHVVTCGWNSGGVGKSNGFIIEEVLLVAHGGWHNDTIVTKEIRTNS